MIRMSLVRLTVLVAMATAALCAAAVGSAVARAPAGTKISLRQTEIGTILANSRGRTLYAFTKDGRNRDRCVTTRGCTSVWPAVTTPGKPRAGSGVKASMLSTIKLPGGGRQVTYGGRPLYTYVGDERAGDTDYVGATSFGGTWLAVNATGRTVR